VITVRDLTKVYTVPVKQPGLWGSLRSLVDRQTRDVRAVEAISFEVAEGERVGFLGPNGAGKTTTLKMLTGLLHPTSGTCEVLGFRPQDRAHDFLRGITLVMGQKQQLLWDLPPRDTFELNRALYDLDQRAWREALDELVDLLALDEVIDRPTRNLSLGQRMRAELAAALLHRPRVLFLDEPTIGLDVEVQALVRTFIRTYATRHHATVLLTSHDMDDVAAIADRIEIPMIVDADNGFGNALNVQRTVRIFERAGAAALQLEDQTLPKRCGHLAGKTLVPGEEMAGKIRAACDARSTEDTLIVARTDAIAVEGFDAASDRAESYLEAGADVLFIEAPRSLDEMRRITSQFGGRIPLLANMVEGGNTPILNSKELEEIGYTIAIFPGGAVRFLAAAAAEYYESLVTTGSNAAMANRMHDFGSLNDVIGTDDMLALGKTYEGKS